MGLIYTPGQLRYWMAEQATFKTPVLDSAAGIELSCDKMTIGSDTKLRRPDRARGQDWPDVFDLSNDAYGSIPPIEFPSAVLKSEIAFFLYMMMQNVTEAATTPFQKVFTYAAPGPDFSANDGLFMSFGIKAPVAATSQKIDSVIGQKLELSLNRDANDGNLYMSFNGIGIGHTRTADPSGTLTKSAQSKFNYANLAACTVDGTPVLVEELKISLENTIQQIGSDGSGKIQNFALSKRKVTGSIKGIWDAAMRGALAKLDSGAEIVLAFNWGTTGVDGYLAFNLHGVVNEGNIAEDAVRGVNITIEGASDQANTEAMLTATVADAVDRNW